MFAMMQNKHIINRGGTKMIGETGFKIFLWVAIIWFYVGSIIIWRYAIPEIYSLFKKKEEEN